MREEELYKVRREHKSSMTQAERQEKCPHFTLRKRREGEKYEFSAYICGNCAQVFEVEKHVPPPPFKPEPMGSEYKTPCGLRPRQA